jgi:hypothetical protein
MRWVADHVAAEHRPKAQVLARSFRATSAAIAAGTLVQPEKILAQTRSMNNEALGSATEAWRAWSVPLEEELVRLNREGLLRVAEDYRLAWEEIAVGLEGVR